MLHNYRSRSTTRKQTSVVLQANKQTAGGRFPTPLRMQKIQKKTNNQASLLKLI